MNKEIDKIRVDKYLWCIRIFKTRSIASDACEKGRVKMNGVSLKASKTVNVGDEYEIRTEARKWIIKVVSLLQNRLAYAEAIKYYTDITPIEEIDNADFQGTAFNTGKRLSKIGRPTKKQRRNLGDFVED